MDLRGQRQEKGFLEAIEPGKAVGEKGILWKCFCHLCGRNYRYVLVRDFKSGRIKKCSKCVNPVFRERQRRLVASIKAKKRELGRAWYSEYHPALASSWRHRVENFSPGQLLLFDAIMNGRTNTQYAIQAVDWVLRTADIELELYHLGSKRVNRNCSRAIERHRELLGVDVKRAA